MQRGGGGAIVAVTIAKRELHPFVVELARRAQPFVAQAAGINRSGGKSERLGGSPGHLQRQGRVQRGCTHRSDRPEPDQDACKCCSAQRVPVTEKPHLTPLCPGIARRVWPARDRIVSAAMLGGAAFILLKTGLAERESSKQVEALLAGLPTILGIRLRHGREPVATDLNLHSEIV